jgi:DNA repair protein RadC
LKQFSYEDLSKEELIKLLTRETPKESIRVRSPLDMALFLKPYMDKEQEHFLVFTLNTAHEVINTHVISIGTVNKTVVHPREVFRPALKDNATAIIVAHNHPSGTLDPSDEDGLIYKRLQQAGELLGITVLDSLITGKNGGVYSFLEGGKL